MNKLHYDINELDQQYTMYCRVLDQYTNLIENKLSELKSFIEDDSSTSKTLLVLKEQVNGLMIINLEKIIEVFAQIKVKLKQIKELYLTCCGEMSLDEEDLENNIICIRKLVSYYEDLEISLHQVPEVNAQHDVEEILDQLHHLENLYQNKIDSMYEFEQNIAHIFNNEIDELRQIQLSMASMKQLEGNSLLNTVSISNINSQELTGEQIRAKFDSMSLEEQEKLVGIDKESFATVCIKQIGCSKQDIDLLWMLYVGCYLKTNDSNKAELEFSRILASQSYHNYAWKTLLGFKYYDPIANLKDIGFSDEEANKLNYILSLQHSIDDSKYKPILDNEDECIINILFSEEENTTKKLFIDYLKTYCSIDKETVNDLLKNKDADMLNYAHQFIETIRNLHSVEGDFTHQMATTAAIINYPPNVADYAGWKGDIGSVLGEFNPSLNARDYASDLDSENINYIQKKYKHNGKQLSYIEASKIYYDSIDQGLINRAKFFTQYPEPNILDYLQTRASVNSGPYGITVSGEEYLNDAEYNLYKNLSEGNHEFIQYK